MSKTRRTCLEDTDPSMLGNARQMCVSWFAVVLLAVNVLASGILPVGRTTADPLAALAQAMEYCSSHDDGQGGGSQSHGFPDDSGHHAVHCVFCLPLLHGGIALPQSASLLEKPIESARLFAFAAERLHFVPARFPSSAPPRAPPSSDLNIA
jgi:hypothetical protein